MLELLKSKCWSPVLGTGVLMLPLNIRSLGVRVIELFTIRSSIVVVLITPRSCWRCWSIVSGVLDADVDSFEPKV